MCLEKIKEIIELKEILLKKQNDFYIDYINPLYIKIHKICNEKLKNINVPYDDLDRKYKFIHYILKHHNSLSFQDFDDKFINYGYYDIIHTAIKIELLDEKEFKKFENYLDSLVLKDLLYKLKGLTKKE